MTSDHIKQVLAHLPSDVIGKSRSVKNIFYGAEPLLRKLRTQIKRKTNDATFEFSGGALTVTLKIELSLPALTKMHETYSTMARDLRVEYDGFEVNVQDDEKPGCAAFAPFDAHVAPGTAFAFPLSDGRFGHAIFIGGGNERCHLFQFVRLVAETPAQLSEVLTAEPLYRQPIPGQIDPLTIVPIGSIDPATLHAFTPVRFRMTHGWPSPEEMDEIARSVDLGACTDDNWHEVQKRLVASGRRIRVSDMVTILEAYSGGANGKLSWKKEETMKISEAEKKYGDLPMQLTGMGRVEYIERALRGETDVIDLDDKTT